MQGFRWLEGKSHMHLEEVEKENSRWKLIWKDKAGGTYLEVAIGILVIVLLISFVLKFLPVLILKNQLNTFATNVSRMLSIEGQYDSSVASKIEEYRKKSEVGEVVISFDGTEFLSGGKKVQLNDLIVVTVTTQYDIGFAGLGSFPIPLKNIANARSEVYWK